MTGIPLGASDWMRSVAGEAAVPVFNRYYEKNPTNLVEQVALLSRPGLVYGVGVGKGPIRQVYSQPGSFGSALFAVSYDELYKIDSKKNVTLLGNGFLGTGVANSPSMAATGVLNTTTPEYLFIASGRELYVYSENSSAADILRVTATPLADNYTVAINAVYYKLVTGSVDTGTPAGTAASPWLVTRGPNDTDTLRNLILAIGATGVPGTNYSTALVKNPDVTATLASPSAMQIIARNPGSTYNAITAVATGANWAFDTPTLANGGTASIRQVYTPNNVGVKSLCYLGGFVIVVIAQGYGVDGRFYWIEPGDTVIKPLNFATAERLPDGINSCRSVGDQLWLFGTDSTEIWYLTGNETSIGTGLFQRVQGKLFDHGTLDGCDVQIGDILITVDAEGVVYNLSGYLPQRISDNSIEQRIRDSIVLNKTKDLKPPLS